jgi:thiol-disulfide isomerase/thioredoxin
MTPGRRRFVVLGGVGAAAALAGAVTGALLLQSRSGAAPLLASSFPDVFGRMRRLGDWQGRPLVCNFWATWCEPCREELPLLDQLYKEQEANRLQVVGIAVDSEANVREFSKRVPLRFPVLIGGVEAIDLMRQLGNSSGALPFTVLLDASGRLRGRKLGPYTAVELSAEVKALMR